MSDDLISKQEVLNKLNELDQQELYLPCHFKEYVIDKVSNIPQKTGRWIDITVGDMPAQACDQCKTFYPLAYTGGGHQYCPNCGAKMESEVE